MTTRHWWQRGDLGYRSGFLNIADVNLSKLAHKDNTPQYFYSGIRVLENLVRLRNALKPYKSQIFYAMKSNRYPGLLKMLKATGYCGIDACSPGEIERAMQCGFAAREISFTATALSDRDLAFLGKFPDLIVNLDSVSALRRWGQRYPGTAVGLRINPETSLGYRDHAQLQYAGAAETKFGIYPNQWKAVEAAAQEYGLRLRGIHCHAGCGFLELDRLPSVLESVETFIQKLDAPEYVNIGGGLGIPLDAEDRALDIDQWSRIVGTFQQRVGCPVFVEPGDYIAKDAGVLVATVTMVERKRDTLFVGLDAGFNAHIEPAFYDLPLHPVPLIEPTTSPENWETVTISGHINEALDIFYRNVPFPPVKEGEQIALLNAGGYGASMASEHCLRAIPTETLL